MKDPARKKDRSQGTNQDRGLVGQSSSAPSGHLSLEKVDFGSSSWFSLSPHGGVRLNACHAMARLGTT
jgi:hypothetical protein